MTVSDLAEAYRWKKSLERQANRTDILCYHKEVSRLAFTEHLELIFANQRISWKRVIKVRIRIKSPRKYYL